MKLNGKKALVTGSSQGIGQAIAFRLAEEGADVVINYHSHPETLGPKPVTKLRSTAAKGTTPLCGRWPSNGSGSCSPVGNTAYPTTPNDINKPSEPVVQTTLRAALS